MKTRSDHNITGKKKKKYHIFRKGAKQGFDKET